MAILPELLNDIHLLTAANFYLIAATLSFEQPTYTVNEADGRVEPVIVLMIPLYPIK